jgi:hypothetical protein
MIWLASNLMAASQKRKGRDLGTDEKRQRNYTGKS